jgi:cellobiose phosphorylase
MDHVNKRLATEYGLVIIDPPYQKPILRNQGSLFNAGMKKAGSIFCHIQGWAVMHRAMLGMETVHTNITMPSFLRLYNKARSVK